MFDYPMTEVIAEREYDFVHGDGEQEVIHVQLGKPAPATDTPHPSWYCPWLVRKSGTSKVLWASGEDSVQALLLALSGLRTDLRLSAAKGKLTMKSGLEGPFMDFA